MGSGFESNDPVAHRSAAGSGFLWGRWALLLLLALAAWLPQAHIGRVPPRVVVAAPIISALLMLAVVFGPQRRVGSSPLRPTRLRWQTELALSSLFIGATGSYVVLSADYQVAKLMSILAVLAGVALAEEAFFRGELLDSLLATGSRASGPSQPLAVVRAIVISQSAFTVVHLPALSLATLTDGGGARPLVVALTGTFIFGCAMALMAMAGGGLAVRSLFHLCINVVAWCVPLGIYSHIARLVALATIGTAVVAAVGHWQALPRGTVARR